MKQLEIDEKSKQIDELNSKLDEAIAANDSKSENIVEDNTEIEALKLNDSIAIVEDEIAQDDELLTEDSLKCQLSTVNQPETDPEVAQVETSVNSISDDESKITSLKVVIDTNVQYEDSKADDNMNNMIVSDTISSAIDEAVDERTTQDSLQAMNESKSQEVEYLKSELEKVNVRNEVIK